MVVLNKVKGIYRGSALVKSVTVGAKKIWPSRTITGYRAVAEFEAGKVYSDGLMEVDEKLSVLRPYLMVEDMRVRAKGSSKSLAATVTVVSAWAEIECEADPKTIGISKGTVCELLAPIYST